MPGDLSNPEFMLPFHYDPKYEPGSNSFESRVLNIEQILQAAAKSARGCPLSKKEVEKAMEYLDRKNLLQRNPGDQDVQESVTEYMKSLSAARKVASRYARSE